MGVRADFSVADGATSAPVEFALTWDMPEVKFAKGVITWKRRYTREAS